MLAVCKNLPMEISFWNGTKDGGWKINFLPYFNIGHDVYSWHINIGWLFWNVNVSW